MIKVRYAAKDDNAKPLLPHPYKPWETAGKEEKHKEIIEKAYRAFKMYENVKEWMFISLPLMWTFAVYGKGMTSLPYISENLVDGMILLSSLLYTFANRRYTKGYVDSTGKRVKPFYLRTNVVKFWLAQWRSRTFRRRLTRRSDCKKLFSILQVRMHCWIKKIK